jgi:hypothetical protein
MGQHPIPAMAFQTVTRSLDPILLAKGQHPIPAMAFQTAAGFELN